jgi:hypothetical protein
LAQYLSSKQPRLNIDDSKDELTGMGYIFKQRDDNDDNWDQWRNFKPVVQFYIETLINENRFEELEKFL